MSLNNAQEGVVGWGLRVHQRTKEIISVADRGYWPCSTSDCGDLEYLASESTRTINNSHSSGISTVLLVLRNHPSMEGRELWGETDVRRAGWVVNTAVSLHRESCISVGYTEIKYISCSFGQREWMCRIKSSSLLKSSKIWEYSQETDWKYQIKTGLGFQYSKPLSNTQS